MVYGLTYVSSAVGVYDKDIYRQIALTSAEFNRTRDITGMLLVYNETVIQFLEGPESYVEGLYARIAHDTRHKNPMVVSRGSKHSREFPDWAMGFDEVVDLSEVGFLFTLNLPSLAQRFPAVISNTTKALLNGFTRSSGLVSSVS